MLRKISEHSPEAGAELQGPRGRPAALRVGTQPSALPLGGRFPLLGTVERRLGTAVGDDATGVGSAVAAVCPGLGGLVAPLLVRLKGGCGVGETLSSLAPRWAGSGARWPPGVPGRLVGWMQVLTESKYSGKQRMGFPWGFC